MTTFSSSFSGGNFEDLVRHVCQWSFLPEGPFEDMEIGHRNTSEPGVEKFVSAVIDGCQTRLFWEDYSLLSHSPGTLFKFELEDVLPIRRFKSVLMELARTSLFELMSTGRLWVKWLKPDGTRYRAPGFSDQHLSHGWACAFKGDGHNRLVSRRWLEHGPWRLIRDEESDLSFIQFHDLEADPETALEQAKPGHQRMGISDEGGFIQTDFVWETEFSGFYLADERQYRIVVAGRDIPQVELLDACALRHYQKLGEDQPIDSIAYVFPEEERARMHLHELWLREIECWAIVNGKEVRLDEDYHPEPEKPAWVLDVEAREAG